MTKTEVTVKSMTIKVWHLADPNAPVLIYKTDNIILDEESVVGMLEAVLKKESMVIPRANGITIIDSTLMINSILEITETETIIGAQG